MRHVEGTLLVIAGIHFLAACGRAEVASSRPAARGRAAALDELTFDLGFDARFDRRNTATDGSSGVFGRARSFRQLTEEREFRETLGGHARGFLLDERVAQFDLGARWGLSQEHYFERRPGPDLHGDPHGDVLEYDGRLELIPAGRLSASLFASRLDDRVPRPFLASLDRTRERYGATLLFNDRALPMRLSFEHTFDDIRGGRGRDDDEQFGRDRLSYEATWQISEHHALRFAYEYEDRDERYSGLGAEFGATRHDFALDHALRFGPDLRSSLDTLVRLEEESGDLARDTLEFAPRLRIQHTPSFATTYGGQYLEETFQQVRLRQARGDLGLIHQLGDALTSTIGLYGLRQDGEDLAGRGGGIDLTDWGGTANFAFAKDNPLGRLSANLSYAHSRARAADGRADPIVIGESVTLRDPQPAFLAHDDVILASVVVTDSARRRVYVAGRDYVVVSFGRRAALQRVRTGRILDGDTVLVSYRYSAFGGYERSRDRLDFRVQQDFQFGLSGYYAGSLQDEDRTGSRVRTFRPRNVNRHRVGLTFRRPSWTIGGELEHNDDAIDPFDAFHVHGDLIAFEDARQQLSGRTRLSRFWFDGSGDLSARATTLLDAGLSYRYVLAPRLQAGLSATYRYETDSSFGRTHGVDVTGSLEYRIGLFYLLFEVEYDVLDLPGSSDNSFAVSLKLRREIPMIGAPRGPDWTRLR